MVAIRVLPPEIVNRIAAGEVVERPSSVVKELVENSIDSGADQVVVHVESGGKKRIRIRDNGRGMAREDLPLAFRSHATSKLPDVLSDEQSDSLNLLDIGTLGFRGEALASIAAVAELDATSRTTGAECAYRYRPGRAGRDSIGPEPSTAPEGTTIDVHNLFLNVPARRKFLRADSTEFSHIVEQVLRVALGFPNVAFVLTHSKRKVLDLPKVAGVRERIAGVVGEEKSRDLLEIHEHTEPSGVVVRGYVGSPRIFRGDSKGQNFFLNNRWVRDRVLSHALKESYQGFQIPGRHPVAYLFVEVPKCEVDFNVHPQKVEVRFRNSQSVHRAVHNAVRGALEVIDVTTLPASGSRLPPAGLEDDSSSDRSTLPRRTVERLERVERATEDFCARDAQNPRPHEQATFPVGRPASTTLPGGPVDLTARAAGGAAAPSSFVGRMPATAFQVLREFIVVETDDGLRFIDQHALHEKVLYERILRRLEALDTSSQRLLLPEVVLLPPELAPVIPDVIERLRPFGFECEPFGDREVAVNAIPVQLERGPAQEVVHEVALSVRDDAGEEARSAEGVISESRRRIAALMACKQAVKAGMKLEPEEIVELLEESEQSTDPRFCPHGRPTAIVMTREELERRFDRK